MRAYRVSLRVWLCKRHGFGAVEDGARRVLFCALSDSAAALAKRAGVNIANAAGAAASKSRRDRAAVTVVMLMVLRHLAHRGASSALAAAISKICAKHIARATDEGDGTTGREENINSWQNINAGIACDIAGSDGGRFAATARRAWAHGRGDREGQGWEKGEGRGDRRRGEQSAIIESIEKENNASRWWHR